MMLSVPDSISGNGTPFAYVMMDLRLQGPGERTHIHA
jgi:hypothetical protein